MAALEIRQNAFRQSAIPQKQLIIIILLLPLNFTG